MIRTIRSRIVAPLGLIVMGLLMPGMSVADSALQVELESCSWRGEDTVVCSFQFASSLPAAMAITGGQYSVAVDGSGKAWHATQVRVGASSGLAVDFHVAPGSRQQAEVWFSGLDRSVNNFETLTLRFNDGYWQTSDVSITVL